MTLTTDKYPCPRWDSNPRSQQVRSWVRIPPGAWIFVCCDCRVLSGRGLCDELITRPEESYRLWCIVVCDLETSRIGAPYIYIYDISSLRVNDLTLILLTWRKWWAPNNSSKQQMGFNSAFKELKLRPFYRRKLTPEIRDTLSHIKRPYSPVHLMLLRQQVFFKPRVFSRRAESSEWQQRPPWACFTSSCQDKQWDSLINTSK